MPVLETGAFGRAGANPVSGTNIGGSVEAQSDCQGAPAPYPPAAYRQE